MTLGLLYILKIAGFDPGLRSRLVRHQSHRHPVQVLRLQVRQQRTLPQTFNNRSLERLFGEFHSVKFFLTRDNLREVIAVR